MTLNPHSVIAVKAYAFSVAGSGVALYTVPQAPFPVPDGAVYHLPTHYLAWWMVATSTVLNVE
jgi:hypothetical protein